MKPEARIKENQARIAVVKTWAKRVDRLKKRKENPLKESEFCRKHGFNPVTFNRHKKLHMIPREAEFTRTEAALQAEGV